LTAPFWNSDACVDAYLMFVYHLEDQGVDGRMGSKWTLGRLVGGCGVDSPGSGWGPMAGCCECGDEPSGSGDTELVSKYSSVLPLREAKLCGVSLCV
jgi:hypothetical protein